MESNLEFCRPLNCQSYYGIVSLTIFNLRSINIIFNRQWYKMSNVVDTYDKTFGSIYYQYLSDSLTHLKMGFQFVCKKKNQNERKNATNQKY